MADATTRKIIGLLESGHAEDVRVAAARVLSEIGSRDRELEQALARAIDDSSGAVRLQALAALGQLRVERLLPKLLDRISTGGPESELAAQAVARLGSKGTQALQKLMHQVAPGLRPRLAAALASAGTSTGNTAAVDALLDKDAGVVNAAVSSLMAEIRNSTPAQRRALAQRALDFLKPKKSQPLSTPSESALIRLLAALGDARAENVLWQRLDRAYPADLRATALQALGTMGVPRDKNRIHQLVECASDRDFRVAAPALMVLKSVPVSETRSADWLPLLAAPDPAVRRFALEKIGNQNNPEVAQALLAQLDHPDRGLQDEAISRVAQTKAGREAFARAILSAPTPEATWKLARAGSRFASSFAPASGAIFKRTFEYIETDDRRGDGLLFLLRQMDPKAFRDRLEERAETWRKKKNYPNAVLYLRLLARDPACSEVTRFELAACGLKLSERDLALDARNNDPALQQFARLLHNAEVPPADRVKRAKWLGPEELFYLGFHFIESNGPERAFGAEMLEQAIKRSPRSKVAKDAKSKLRGAGL